MEILVLGANGLLGSNIVATACSRGTDVAATYHSTRPGFDIELFELDIVATEQFANILETASPDAVINCAAMTDVDACETDSETAREVNGRAPGRIARKCEQRNVPFVHVSTDYVFNGETTEPYTESAPTDPSQVYGRSKALGEERVVSTHSCPVIPRLSFVYGQHGDDGQLTGFPQWVRTQLQMGGSVPLFTDQWITPTRAGQAAETILDLVWADTEGVYHVAPRSCVTPFEFGTTLATRMEQDPDAFSEGSLNAVDRPARRPSHTCLAVSKVETALGRAQPTLGEDLDQITALL